MSNVASAALHPHHAHTTGGTEVRGSDTQRECEGAFCDLVNVVDVLQALDILIREEMKLGERRRIVFCERPVAQMLGVNKNCVSDGRLVQDVEVILKRLSYIVRR